MPPVFLKYPEIQPSQAEEEVQVVHPPGQAVHEVTGDPLPKYPEPQAAQVAAVVASPAVAYPHPETILPGETHAPLEMTQDPKHAEQIFPASRFVHTPSQAVHFAAAAEVAVAIIQSTLQTKIV